MATVIQAYRFALDPTPSQRRALASHCGAARYAYNWGLRLVQERLDQRQTGEDIEVPWADSTGCRNTSTVRSCDGSKEASGG
jgi:hypothetical protein